MSPGMIAYLSLCYQRDVLGDHRAKPETAWREELREEAKREVARINKLNIADLAQRDFALHQHRKALMRALEKHDAS